MNLPALIAKLQEWEQQGAADLPPVVFVDEECHWAEVVDVAVVDDCIVLLHRNGPRPRHHDADGPPIPADVITSFCNADAHELREGHGH